MKIHRFFIKEKINGESIIIADKELIHQLKNVLRLQIGDRLCLLDNTGREFLCQIEDTSKNAIVLKIISEEKTAAEPAFEINIFQSIIKKENFEWVLQKCTEAGATSFTPIMAERSEKKGLNLERLQKIAKEATEQSGRKIIPIINTIASFTDAIKQASGPIILLDASGEHISKIGTDLKITDKINIFIGPEGGWSETELLLAKEFNAKIINLGPRTFRSETAGLVATAIILNAGIIPVCR